MWLLSICHVTHATGELWILILLNFSNSHIGLMATVLQTLLSHEQGPSRCIPVMFQPPSSWLLPAQTSRKALSFFPTFLCEGSFVPPTATCGFPTCPEGVLEGRGCQGPSV